MLGRFAMRLVLAAERAVLAELEPVRIVAPVLPGDVVAVLALLTGQGDLGPDVGRSHGGAPFSCWGVGLTGNWQDTPTKTPRPPASPLSSAHPQLEPPPHP